MRTAKAQARLRGCAGWSEALLLRYALISLLSCYESVNGQSDLLSEVKEVVKQSKRGNRHYLKMIW